ncbi:MmcQ/YjbR family DNA-binding protein [candidate division KSB1 bacterium]|nr:MmcQ/YjbR family DNA-binding protein [candidate division KSB1 bacterium]
MELEALRHYLKAKPGAYEDMPFGPDALVTKVMKKMFCLIAWESEPFSISLKCDPEYAQTLRSMYPAIIPGYHFNKDHWNTITIDGSIPDELICEMIDDSYQLVVSKLPKVRQMELKSLSGNDDASNK